MPDNSESNPGMDSAPLTPSTSYGYGSSGSRPPDKPHDRFFRVLFLFVLYGMITSLPWNFFATAEGYWMYKLREVNASGPVDPHFKTELQAKFTSYLSVCAMTSNAVGFLIGLAIADRISQTLRVLVPLGLVSLLFVVTLLLVETDTDSWQLTFFLLTMLTTVLMNGLISIFGASVFGLAGRLRPRFTQAAMSGQAVGGILAALARIFTLYLGSSDIKSAFYYFMIALATLLLTIASYPWLLRLPTYRYYMGFMSDECFQPLVNSSSEEDMLRSMSRMNVLRKISKYAFSIVVLQAATLATYPALTVLEVSRYAHTDNPWTGKYFLPVTCFLLFNSGDLAGRLIASWAPFVPSRGPWLPLLCVARVVYVPLFIMCNLQPRAYSYLPVVFDHDTDFIIIMTTFSVSNGMLATLAMSYAPEEVPKDCQEKAGTLMGLFMGIGISIGALLSVPLVHSL